MVLVFNACSLQVVLSSTICSLGSKVFHSVGKDTSWALYAQQGENSDKQAAGDMCEGCYHCHEAYFPYWSWSELCSKHTSDVTVREMVVKAKGLLQASGGFKGKEDSVHKDVSCSFEILKKYKVATEKDLRKLCGVDRLGSRTLSFLPCLSMPGEKGEIEQVYAFKADDDDGIRDAILKVAVTSHHSKVSLPSGFSIGSVHAEALAQHMVTETQNDIGLQQLFDRNHPLKSLPEWVASKPNKEVKVVDDASDGLAVSLAAETAFVGPAAAAATAAASMAPSATPAVKRLESKDKFTTPSNKSKCGSLASSFHRANSTTSMDGGTQLGDDHDALSVSGRSNMQTTVTQATGDTELAQWKNKVPLASCLVGVDGRSMEGMKRAYTRLCGDEATKLEGSLLKSYHSLCLKTCCLATEKECKTVSESELKDILEQLSSHDVQLPAKVQSHLTKRMVQKLKDEQEWESLLQVIVPFGVCHEPWTYEKPYISALSETECQKVTWFQDYLYSDVLGPLVMAGEEKKEGVTKLVALTLDVMSSDRVDVVEMGDLSARAHDECVCICSTLQSLLQPKWRTFLDSLVLN
eukprot:1607525-Amphidinium_carterae.4